MQQEFTEKDPTKWKALVADQCPWATIIDVTKTGIICFDTLENFTLWKATQ